MWIETQQRDKQHMTNKHTTLAHQVQHNTSNQEALEHQLQHTTIKQEALEHQVQHNTSNQEALEHQVQHNTSNQEALEHQVQHNTSNQEALEGRFDQIEKTIESSGSPSGTKSYDDINKYLLRLYESSMPKLEMPAWCGVTSPFQLFTPISVREDLEFRFADHHLQAMFPGPDDRETSESRSGKPITSYREIFYKDDRPQRDIFMIGEAGVGKCTFCYHLVHLWCMLQSQTPLPPMNGQDKDLLSVLREFSFLFLIRCRDVNRNDDDLSAKPTRSVFQMIKQLCPKSPYEKIVEIFNVFREKCLVIIDGLDGSASEESGTLSPKGLPDCKDVYGSTVLMTSRPWRVEALGQGLAPFCRVLQIDGLEEDGVETMSCKILQTMDLSKEEGDVKAVYDKFHQQLKQHKMEEIVRQPLMLYIILREWHSGNQTLHRSLSINYTVLIESVLNHSEEKMLHKLIKTERKEDKQPLPPCFQGRETCLKYSSQIRKIASLAFDTLVRQDKEKSLVFTQKELVDHIGKDDLDLCLRLGILSESKASSPSYVRLVTISFLHKSIQECLASVHISEDTTGHCLTEFTSKLTSLSDIFDIGNILIFLFGMSPSKGQQVMKHVCGVVEHCPEIKAYRQYVWDIRLPEDVDYENIVKLIQQLYTRCIVEQEHSGLCPTRQDTTKAPGYCIPDIVIDKDIPTDMIQHLCRPGKHIKSLVFLNSIETPAYIIQSLNTTLKHIEKLKVYISARGAEKYIKQLCQSFSSLKQLKLFCLFLTSVYPYSLTQATYFFTKLGKLPSLMSLALNNLDLTAMVNCRFPKNLASLSLYIVNFSANLVVPQYCTTVWLHKVTVPGRMYISPVCSRLIMGKVTLSDLSTLPNSLTKLAIFQCTPSPTALQHLNTFINTTSGLQWLYLEPPAGCRISLCKPVDMSPHLSLHRLVLERVDLQGCGIVLPQNAREVDMEDVSMSGEHWYLAVENMSSCHNVDVWLTRVRTLDQRTVEFISQHFTVTQDMTDEDKVETDEDGYRTIQFHTNRSSNPL